MMIEIEKYNEYVLKKMRPHKKACVKIYDEHGEFLQTCNNMTDAKRLVDFCQKHGVWK